MDRVMFDDAPLWPILENLKQMLEGDLAGEVDEGRSEIRLAHSVVQYVDSLRGVDPGLVDEATLASISDDLTNGRDYLTSYLDDRDANSGLLTSSAFTSFTAARAAAIQAMPPPPPDERVRAAQEATSRYRVLGASNDSAQFLISKSSVGIIGLILAGYTARQAAEHRHEERTANRLALDLAALEPFLEHVENPDELRKQIAERVFVPEQRQSDEPRFAFGRRGMSLADLSEFIKIIRSPPG